MKRCVTILLATYGLSIAATTACEGWWIGGGIGPRFNMIGGPYVDDMEARGQQINTSTNFGVGVISTYDLCPIFRLEGSLFFDQRGFNGESGQGSFTSTFKETWNYIDLQLGGNLYPLGTDGTFQPYVGAFVQPGYFFGGSYTYTYGGGGEGSSRSGSVDADDLESINLGVNARIGADVKIGSLLLGASVGYEYGFTNIHKAEFVGEQFRDKTVNAVVVVLRVMVPLWSADATN
jgi:outer membrane protein W